MAKAEFPSNSHSKDLRLDQIEKLKSPQQEPDQEKTEEPSEKEVFEGKVFVKRKKLGPRLKSMFVTDGMSFVDHLVENVVVPMVKDILLSVVVQIGDNTKRGFEQMLFPNGSSTNDARTSRGSGPISYDRLHQSSTTIHRGGSAPRPQPRQSNRVRDIEFEYRSDAQKALTYVESQIEEIGHCTVGDFYDYLREPLDSTDHQWGWADVSRGAYISEVGPNLFRLILPDPRPIHRR